MNWLERVKKNIFPLSEEKSDILIALEEWKYFNTAYDLGYEQTDCELCNHPGIRYQFEIENTLNGNSLLIGSECIKRFDIGVVDDYGKVLKGKEAQKKVTRDRNKLITDAKFKSVINTLIELSKKEEDFEIEKFINYYQERKAFTPKQLFLLIWRLDTHKISYNKSYFKMIIRRNREKQQLLDMEDWRIMRIWPCLSDSQKRFVEDNGKATFLE